MISKNKLLMTIFIGLSIFATTSKADETECKDKDLAKSNYIESCTGYMQGRALSGGGDISRGRILAECKCTAQNFHVENMANKKCEFDLADIETAMKLPKIKVVCKQ